MQILQVTQRIITIFGMCTLPNGSDFRIHSRQIIVMLVSLIIMVQLNLFSVFYVVEHLIGEDLRSSTFAMMQVIAIFSTIASFASLIYHKKSVRRFFERLQAIVTQYKSSESLQIYKKVDEFCEKFFIWMTLFMVISYIASTFMPVAIASIFYYFKRGYVDARELNLPLKLKTPFDQNTLRGFSGVLVIELIGGSMFLTVTYIISSLFLSMGLYFRAFSRHFELMFEQMDAIRGGVGPAKQRTQLLKMRLIDAVNLHNDAKDIFELCRRMLSAMIFYQLVTAALYISGVNFELETVVKAANVRILIAVISIVTSAGNIFLYCFVGTMTTDTFHRFSAIAYESLWYQLPLELQKFFQFIIANGNRPRALDGYGIMDLNLVAFAKVMKSAISFYLMIKTFTE